MIDYMYLPAYPEYDSNTYSVAEKMNQYNAASIALVVVGHDYCTGGHSKALSTVKGRWHACKARDCTAIFNNIYRSSGDQLVNINTIKSVKGWTGGLNSRSCRVSTQVVAPLH